MWNGDGNRNIWEWDRLGIGNPLAMWPKYDGGILPFGGTNTTKAQTTCGLIILQKKVTGRLLMQH